ncbi:MAG: hypothetical protein ACI89L_001334 [Phycisphaerales bacterium]|jgi:hypothetical protein
MTKSRLGLLVLSIGLASGLIGGCETQPNTYPAPPRAQPSIDDMLSAGESASEQLAGDLQRLIDEDFGGSRVLLVMGDIDNQTRSISTSEFNLLADRMRTSLRRSKKFRDNVKLVEKAARQLALSDRERGGGAAQPGGDTPVTGGVSQTDAQIVFFLNGTAHRLSRPDGSYMYVNYELMRESDGEIVFAGDYDVRY